MSLIKSPKRSLETYCVCTVLIIIMSPRLVGNDTIQLLTSDEVDLLIYQPGECDIHRGHDRGEYHIPRVDKSRGQPISEVNNCFIKLFQNSINNAFIE